MSELQSLHIKKNLVSLAGLDEGDSSPNGQHVIIDDNKEIDVTGKKELDIFSLRKLCGKQLIYALVTKFFLWLFIFPE